MQKMKGYVAGMVALVACPCHLPLTLPILLVLTSGTAVGGWLAANQWLVWLSSFVMFLGGMMLMMRWMNPASAQCEIPQQKQMPTPAAMEPQVERYINASTLPKEVPHV